MANATLPDEKLPDAKLAFVVLAGERPGGSPLALAMGVAAGVLVDVAGQTAIERVFAALRASTFTANGVLCGPLQSIVADSTHLQALLAPGDIRWLAPATGPAASAVSALEQLDSYPALVTTADHALLTGAMIDAFCERALAQDADFVVGLVPYDCVRAAFPESKRTVLRFSDGGYCGSNLFCVRSERGLKALLFWRQVESLRKRPWKIARHLGLFTLLRYQLGRLRSADAFALLSRKAGCTLAFVELPIARAAVDVDSVADRELAEQLLLGDRQAGGTPAVM